MKNFVLNLSVVFALLTMVSCQKEIVKPNELDGQTQTLDGRKPSTTCTDYFYYYNDMPSALGQVNLNQIIIGFEDGLSLQEKQNFIANYTFLDSIIYNSTSGSADVTTVTLKPGLTCLDVENNLKLLAQQAGVRYANPTFKPAGSVYEYLGVTNQFLVTLKSTASYTDLQQLATKTKTQIVGQLYGQTYILSAVKTSNGNALEMANYFHTNSKVEYAEPDFLMVMPQL